MAKEKSKLDKKEVARVLSEVGTLLELKGENPFKTRAFHSAARTLETLDRDLLEMIEDGSLAKVRGIGKSLHENIEELVRTGELTARKELRASIPDGLWEMLRIAGLGPKKIRAMHEKLGISTLGELEYACHENRLADLKGFGVKTQENILKGIDRLKKDQGRVLYSEAMNAAQPILEALKESSWVDRVSIAGSLRRHRETVKDLDFVVATRSPAKVSKLFAECSEVEEVIGSGKTKTSVLLSSGIQADLRVVTEAEFPFALHHFTGSKEHNQAMRTRAKKLGLKMNEYGVFKGDKLVACKSEDEVFAAVGLKAVPPEMREDTGEIEAAEKGKMPRLVQEDQIRGVLHIHTTASDGLMTLEETASACQAQGMEYAGICDHSKAAFYANGLDETRLAEQGRQIDELNKKLKGFRLLKGIEVDILADGALDFDDEVLSKLDFAIASIHSGFRKDENLMTERTVRAISNRYINILGHPTGRLLLAREPYPLDMKKVLDTAARSGVAVEINSHPRRLDLDWRECRYGSEAGLKVALNPDAHRESGLEDWRYGVGIARKGWYGPDGVINTYPLKRILEFFAKRRKAR